MSVSSRSLIPERVDVEELERRLKDLGWEDGVRYGLTKNLLLEDFIVDRVFEGKFNELNRALLADLSEEERREVLDCVKNILRSAPEDSLLDYLKYGVECTVKRREKRTYRLIDFENPSNNSLIYAREIKYPGRPENIKPDFTLFVNGLPIVIIEVKPSTRIGSEEEAIDQIRRYEQESPELFRYVQLAVVYAHEKLFLPTYPNWGKEARLTPGQTWRVKMQEEGGIVRKESIEHLLQPDVLLNLIRWYTFFREKGGVKDKIIARYNQYFASEKALQRIARYLDGKGREERGLIWHWQGSGKTYTMFFIANKYFEQYFSRDPLVFFVVDRLDLQRQLKDFLEALKAPKFKSYLKVIESIEELKQEIATIKRSEYMHGIAVRGIRVVLIQKFQRRDFEELLVDLAREQIEYLKHTNEKEYKKIVRELTSLSSEERDKRLIELGGVQKREVLLLIDEAHRSQYGLLASMMKNVFPNALRFAFTGTPVFNRFENNTFAEFAYPPREYYLDVYFIRDSIADNFTLPIVYDVVQEGALVTEGVKILLDDRDIKEYIEYWIEISGGGSPADEVEAFLETGQLPRIVTRKEIWQHLNKIRIFLTNERRLEKLAQYIARRIRDDTEDFKYKAMVVVANREACVLMRKFLVSELKKLYGEEAEKWIEVVMTYQHNDTGVILEYKEQLFKRRGKRDVNEINLDIQREFKEEENPKILIVTDMLITGFDVPLLKVMYLDKPLYEHRLLQAIARVNRPYKTDMMEKKYGLIVDSVGLLRHVKESIRKYELIADRMIIEDLEENVFDIIENKVEEFKKNLKSLKEYLKTLKIQDRDLSIDIDWIKMKIKVDKRRALETVKGDLDEKMKLIAVFWDTLEVQKLLSMIKETIDQFKALGSHREKIHYVEEIVILSYVYGIILHYIKGGKVPREFWDGLIRLIHEKTLFEEFNTIVKSEISYEDLQKLEEKIAAGEIIRDHEVADAYRIIKSLLEKGLDNPVYRAIYKRIESVRREWIARNIDTKQFIKELLGLEKRRREYDEKIAGKPVVEKIVETVNVLVNQEFNFERELTLELAELRKTIPKVLKVARIVSSHVNELRTALMKDLFREMREQGIDTRRFIIELRNFAEKVTEEYIVKEIEKARITGGATL